MYKIQSERCMHWALTALVVASAGPASGQSFESVFGAPGIHEYGFKAVRPVTACAGGGYVAVGSSGTNFLQLWCGPPPANSRVYVVRANAVGTTVWEGVYDVGGAPNFDLGSSLVELSNGSGFVVTGTTDPGTGNDDAFLLKVDCNGNVVWTQRYNSIGNGHEYGIDVIEMPSLAAGNPYDLAVAGVTRAGAQLACLTPGTGGNGLLFRTDANGVLRWSMSYDMGAEEGLASLAQAVPAAVTGGDLLAVGKRNVPGVGSFAVALRASGLNGSITLGVGLQGMADYGPAGALSDFRAVEPLLSSAEIGNVAMVGATTAGGMFLAKHNGNPCVPLVDQVVLNTAGWDLVEVRTPQGATAPGDIAVAGEGFGDAVLLSVAAGTLAPIPLTAMAYGDHAGFFDGAASLAEVVPSSGFVLAGVSTSQFDTPLDPQDLYLVKTGPANTTCGLELPWAPVSFQPNWPVTCYQPQQTPVLKGTPTQTPMAFATQWFRRTLCP